MMNRFQTLLFRFGLSPYISGANELSVHMAVYMVMGANIGTSVTNT